MEEAGFRPCSECGKRALIELADGNGRICARCYVRRRRSDSLSNRVASEALIARSGPTRANSPAREEHFRKH